MVEPSSLAETVTPSSFWPDCALLIGVSLFLRFVRQHGNGSHIGDDCVDLRRLEVILERGHALGAVDDEGAHDLVVPGGRRLVQHRPVGLHAERRLQVADAARLREHLAAEPLRFVEVRLLRVSGGRGEREHQCEDSVFHSVPPAAFWFLAAATGDYPSSGEEFQPGQAGSKPCFLMTDAAAGAVMNLTSARAASACFAPAWMPAENMVMRWSSPGSGPT